MNCLILSLAVLIPVISGAISLVDENAPVDASLRQAASPCCIPKGKSMFFPHKIQYIGFRMENSII